MKRIYVFFCFVLIITVTLQAQNSISSENKNIQMANQLYKQGQYADAARLYENELKKGVAAELYYNLGNSYYKSNEIGMAILNYERALRLDPDYEDARYNLKIAESKIVDNVNSTPTFFVKRLFNALITSNTSNHWTVISFVCFIVALVLFFFFVFSRNSDILAAWMESPSFTCLESTFNESCPKQVIDINVNIKNNIFFMT